MSTFDQHYQQALTKLGQTFGPAQLHNPKTRAASDRRSAWTPGSFVDPDQETERTVGGWRRPSQLLGTFHSRPPATYQGQATTTRSPLLSDLRDQPDDQMSRGLRRRLRDSYGDARQQLMDSRMESDPATGVDHDLVKRMRDTPYDDPGRDQALRQLLLQQGRRIDSEGNLINAPDLTWGDIAARTDDPRTLLIRARDAGLISQDEIAELGGESRGRILAPDASGDLQEVPSAARAPRRVSPELRRLLDERTAQNIDTQVDPRVVQGRMSIERQPQKVAAAYERRRLAKWAELEKQAYHTTIQRLRESK